MLKKILPIVLALMIIAGAIGHAFMPEFYAPMIPEFISENLANYLSILFEGGIGIALLIPKYRRLGGLGFMLLMIGFLPIHIWDYTKEVPAIGPPPAPLIRIIVQLLLIYAGYWIYKTHANKA
jgi:uncharacterized membrane protein